MKKINSENGITIVALVITVIVLLQYIREI